MLQVLISYILYQEGFKFLQDTESFREFGGIMDSSRGGGNFREDFVLLI